MRILSTNFPHLDEGLVLHGILASRVSQLVDVDHPACGAPREGPGRKGVDGAVGDVDRDGSWGW